MQRVRSNAPREGVLFVDQQRAVGGHEGLAGNERADTFAFPFVTADELTGGDAGLAKDYVNKIRRRAGIAELGAVTLDDVINERRLEFVGEGKRYFDLVRTGKAASVLVPDEYGYRTNSWTESKKYIPIAQAELDSDPALVQNNY